MKSLVLAVAVFLCWTIPASHAQKADGLLKIGDRPPVLDFRVFKSEKLVDWASLKGRVVVIEFWATWCPPCIKNIPHLNGLAKQFANRPVTFISVTYETEQLVEKFQKDHPIKTIIGLDNDFAMFKSYRAWGIPMTVIVNNNGRIASVLHPDNLNESVINEVLSGKVPRVRPAQAWSDPEGAEQYFRSLVKTTKPKK